MIDWKKVLSIYATIAIPLLYIYNIFLAYAYPQTLSLTFQVKLLGLFLAVIGIVIWITTYLHLGFSFGVLPQKQKRVTRGLYAYFNHPMYGGIYLTFLGLSLANSSLPGLLFLNCILLPVLFLRANAEDKQLHD